MPLYAEQVLIDLVNQQLSAGKFEIEIPLSMLLNVNKEAAEKAIKLVVQNNAKIGLTD